MSGLEFLFVFNLCFSTLFVIYYFLLSKLTFFSLNRVVLLAIPILSLVICLLPNIFIQPALLSNSEFYGMLTEFHVTDRLETSPSIESTITVIYFIGLTLFLFNTCLKIMSVHQLIKKAKKKKVGNYYLISSIPEMPTFSFLNYLHIRDEDNNQMVFDHELTHVKQRHSYDLLAYEILKTINWFNPFLYLAKIQLGKVHEFLADKKSSQQNLVEYCHRLISNSQRNTESLLFNFNSNNHLKSRIIMLTKPQSKKIAKVKYLMLVPVIALLAFTAHSNELNHQNITTKVESTDSLFTNADVMPVFGNGNEDLMNFLIENLKYPKEAKKDKLEGKVFVSFIVDTNGKVREGKIEKGVHELLDNEALRVVNAMPNWKPGENNGKKVKVKMTLPVVFKLQ